MIWHIDNDKRGVQNDQEGHPDQNGWPENNRHYLAAVLAADGEYKLEATPWNKGDEGDVWKDCREISPTTVPNTKGYQSGVIKDTGITIKNIKEENGNMVFDLCLDSCADGSTSTCSASSGGGSSSTGGDCSSDSAWMDNYGDSCAKYLEAEQQGLGWCSSAADYANNGVSATTACCACKPGCSC